MKRLIIALVLISTVVFFTNFYMNHNSEKDLGTRKVIVSKPIVPNIGTPFDSTSVPAFFLKYPKFKPQKTEVLNLYRKHKFQYLWYDGKGINEFADLLYDKINNLKQEGIQVKVPYKELFQSLFQDPETIRKSDLEVELLMSSLYFFYADHVYKGFDIKKTIELGWYLSRKKQSYGSLLDSLLRDPNLINDPKKDRIGQYILLKNTLKQYREIEEKGGWVPIVFPKNKKSLKPGDTGLVFEQIRSRLFKTGDLKINSKKKEFDKELTDGILKYKECNAFTLDPVLLPKHINEMNVSVNERIKTIMVNMERCRWIGSSINNKSPLIVVNIPSFTLTFFRDGKREMVSKVVVGKSMNKTVIFSGEMSQIIFSPYWNVPSSILRKEILPAISRNPNYLVEHDMEWVKDRVRQRPGLHNSLGLVKFIFPNSNNIYLHDTPYKNLFNAEQRTFSHGCIRVERPRELALLVLKNDKNWSPEKIDAAMYRGVEKTYSLKTKIPVYIGYFTAWVDDLGQIHFYEDVYNRDKQLASLLLKEN